MEAFRALADVPAFTGLDGACVRELAGHSTGLASLSLALIVHPSGTSSTEHRHEIADEVYFVREGHGSVMVDGAARQVGPGDTVIIRAGQRHKVWGEGPGDLVLIVACSPAYEAGEVRWEERPA